MRPNRAHALFALVALLAACGGSGSSTDHSLAGNLNGAGVLLATERSSYQQGTTVELTIQNQESARLGYNACTRGLEVREGATWLPGPASLRLCSKEVSYVEAGAIRTDSTGLDLGLTPGEYRIVLTLARDYAPDGDAISAVSNTFTITP